MTVTENINLKKLYEIDDYLWIQETVNFPAIVDKTF